jgi:nucleoside diphosphate kinase
VIKYGRKLIGATDPQKSEPGTIRGDLAVVVGRYWFERFTVFGFFNFTI